MHSWSLPKIASVFILGITAVGCVADAGEGDEGVGPDEQVDVSEQGLTSQWCYAGNGPGGALWGNATIKDGWIYVWFQGNQYTTHNNTVTKIVNNQGVTVSTIYSADNIKPYVQTKVHQAWSGHQHYVKFIFDIPNAPDKSCTAVVG